MKQAGVFCPSRRNFAVTAASSPLSGQADTLAAVARMSRAKLDELVQEAIVDAYGEDEQLMGLHAMIEEYLALPFPAMLLGVEVTVGGIELTERGIAAVCMRGPHRQLIDLLEFPSPVPPPPGWEWIAAYRHWAGRR